jgi:sulfur transfer complex TusBCD TusB component (DsrH family)
LNKKIIGFTIIAITMMTIVVWEFWGRENLSYQNVLVLKEDLQANTIIDESCLKVVKCESPGASSLRPKDAQSIVGLATAQYVAAGTELRFEYFSEAELTYGGSTDRGVMALPTDWLLSCTQNLRRGDKVILYNDTVQVLEAIVLHSKDSSNQEIRSQDKDRLTATGIVNYIDIVANKSDLVYLAELAKNGNRFTLVVV